jgi:g-D-glutamyl-meso-diaminopimelate peptidase
VERNRTIVPTNVPWSSGLLEITLQSLQARYPFLHISSIGNSVLGRPIYLVRIGRGPIRVGYSASHHANEWITTPILLRFLALFAACLTKKGRMDGLDCQALYNRFTLEIIPMVNPDGVGLA